MPSYPPEFRPSDTKEELLAAVELSIGVPCSRLAARFESFGNDCEFGFVQRCCGAEPLGPFRFSNPQHEAILRAITSGFADYESVEVELDHQPHREYIVVNHFYGLREHTFSYEGDMEESAIFAQQRARAALLKRLALENLDEGTKICVIKSGEGFLTEDICLRISLALQKLGPNVLLWVEQGEHVGKVEVLGRGLLRGVIDRLTVQPHGSEFSLCGWLAVLANAWSIVAAAEGRL